MRLETMSESTDPKSRPSRLWSIFKSKRPSRSARETRPASPASWTHHASYFPEYTPIMQPQPTVVDTYATGNEPILGDTHSQALATASAHAALVGHPVAVHYPSLPKFDDYPASKNWRRSTWGMQGWTGFGWAGETLPDKNGLVFGNPMPEGKAFGDHSKDQKEANVGGEGQKNNKAGKRNGGGAKA